VRRLIIRPGAIGDCILSIPAMEHLVGDYTEVWVPSPLIPLIQFADAARSIASTGLDLLGIPDRETPEQLHAKLQSFDSIVSWYGSNRSEFRNAMLSINPNCEFHSALPRDFSVHATDFFATQAGVPLGLIPRIRVEKTEPRNTVAIHPFSGSKKKNWPLHRYCELAAQLGCEVDWLAGPEEELPEARRFENLAELAAFIAGAHLYIGNDSGITHLAAAVGIKTLAIFGPKSPKIWEPRGENVYVVRGRPLESLSVRVIADAANRLLDSP
jgi:hypothetical protein